MSRRLRAAALHLVLGCLSALTLFPFLVMVLMAGKDRAQIQTRFWGLPNPVRWENFATAAGATAPFVANSIIVSFAVTAICLGVSALAA